MVKSYYVFTNTNNGVKELVPEKDLSKVKESKGINKIARGDGYNIYNGYRITRFTQLALATTFLNENTTISKPIMISNKTQLFSNSAQTHKMRIDNMQSKNDLINNITNVYHSLIKRDADMIYITFTYIKDINSRPIYKMYSILFKSQFDALMNDLQNNYKIGYEQEDGTMRNYEEDGHYLDFSAIEVIFRANIVVGVKINSISQIETQYFTINVISPPDKSTSSDPYNCLVEILCLIFENRKTAINRY